MAVVKLRDILDQLEPEAREAYKQQLIEEAARARMDEAMGGRAMGTVTRGVLGAGAGILNAGWGLGTLAYKALPGDAGSWADRPLFGNQTGLISDAPWQTGTAYQLGNFGGFIASLAGGGPLAEAKGIFQTVKAINPMARVANASARTAEGLWAASRIPKLLGKVGPGGELAADLTNKAVRGAGHLAGAEFFTAPGTVQERAMRAAHAAPAGALFGLVARPRGVRDASGKLLTKPADVEAALMGRGPKLAEAQGLIKGQESLLRYGLGQGAKGFVVGGVLGPDSAPVEHRDFTSSRRLNAALFHALFMGVSAATHGRVHKADAARAKAFDKAKQDAMDAAAALDRNTVNTASSGDKPGVYAYLEPTRILREQGFTDEAIAELVNIAGPGRIRVLGKEVITDPITGQESTGRVFIESANGEPVAIEGSALTTYVRGTGVAAQRRMFEEAHDLPVEAKPEMDKRRMSDLLDPMEAPNQTTFDFADPVQPSEVGQLRLFDQGIDKPVDLATADAPPRPNDRVNVNDWIATRFENAEAAKAAGATKYLPEGWDIIDTPFGPSPQAPRVATPGQGRLFDKAGRRMPVGKGREKGGTPDEAWKERPYGDLMNTEAQDLVNAGLAEFFRNQKAGKEGKTRHLDRDTEARRIMDKLVEENFPDARLTEEQRTNLMIRLETQASVIEHNRRLADSAAENAAEDAAAAAKAARRSRFTEKSLRLQFEERVSQLMDLGYTKDQAVEMSGREAIDPDLVPMLEAAIGRSNVLQIKDVYQLGDILAFVRGERATFPGSDPRAATDPRWRELSKHAHRSLLPFLNSVVRDALSEVPAALRPAGDLTVKLDLSPGADRGSYAAVDVANGVVKLNPSWLSLPRHVRVDSIFHELVHLRTMAVRAPLEQTGTRGSILHHFLTRWGWNSRHARTDLMDQPGNFEGPGALATVRRLVTQLTGGPIDAQIESQLAGMTGVGDGTYLQLTPTREGGYGLEVWRKRPGAGSGIMSRQFGPEGKPMSVAKNAHQVALTGGRRNLTDELRFTGKDEVTFAMTGPDGRTLQYRWGDGDAAGLRATDGYKHLRDHDQFINMLYLGDNPRVNKAGQKFYWIPLIEGNRSKGRTYWRSASHVQSMMTDYRLLTLLGEPVEGVANSGHGLPKLNGRYYAHHSPGEFVAELVTEATKVADPWVMEQRFPGFTEFVNTQLGGWNNIVRQSDLNKLWADRGGPLFKDAGEISKDRPTLETGSRGRPDDVEGHVRTIIDTRGETPSLGKLMFSAKDEMNPAQREVQRFMSEEYAPGGQFDKDARSFSGLSGRAGGKKIGGKDQVDPAELEAVRDAGLQALIEYGESWKPSWATDPKIPSLREYYRAAMKAAAAEWRQVNMPGGTPSPVKIETRKTWTRAQLEAGRTTMLQNLFARGAASFAEATKNWKKWQKTAILMRYGPLFPLDPGTTKVFPPRVTSKGTRPWTIKEIAERVGMSETAVRRFINQEFPMGKADHPSPYDPTRNQRGPRTFDAEAERLEATRGPKGQMVLPGIDRDALFMEANWVNRAFEGKLSNEEFFAGNEQGLPTGGVRDQVTGHLFEPGQSTQRMADAITERTAMENQAGLIPAADAAGPPPKPTPVETELAAESAAEVRSPAAEAVDAAVNKTPTRADREKAEREAAAAEAKVLEEAGDTVAATAARARAKFKLRGMTPEEFATLSFANQIRHASARFNAAAKEKHYVRAMQKYATLFEATGKLMPVLRRLSTAKGVVGRREALRQFEEPLQVDIHYDAATPGTIPHWRIQFRDSGATFRARDIASVGMVLDLRLKALAESPDLTPPDGQHIRLDLGPDGSGPKPPGGPERGLSDGESGGDAPMPPAKADLSHIRAWESRWRAVTDWAHAVAKRSGDTNLGVTVNQVIQAAHEMASGRDKRLGEFEKARKKWGIPYTRGEALGEAMAAVDSAVTSVLKITSGNVDLAQRWVEANEKTIFDAHGLSAKEQSFLNWVRTDYLDVLQKEFGVANRRPGYFPFLREMHRERGRAMEDIPALMSKSIDFFADFERGSAAKDIVRNVNIWDVVERYTAAGYRMKFFGERPGAAEPGLMTRLDLIIDQFVGNTPAGYKASTPPHMIRPLLHLKRSILGWTDPRRAQALEARDERIQRRKDRVEALADKVDAFENPVTAQVATALQNYAKALGQRLDRPDAMLWSDHFLVLNRARTFGLHGMRAIRHVTQSGFTVATRVGMDYYGKAMIDMMTDPAVRARVYAEATAAGAITEALPDRFDASIRGVSLGGRLTKVADKTTFLYNTLDKWERGLSWHAQSLRTRWAVENYKKHGNPMRFMEESRVNLLHPIVGEVVMRHLRRGDFEGTVREHARQLVKHSIFDYSRANAPDWAHGVWGRVFGQYGRWPLAMLENMHGMVTYGTKTQRAEVLQTYATVAAAVYGLGQLFGVKTGDWIPFVHTLNYNGGPAVSLVAAAYDLTSGDKRAKDRVLEDFRQDPVLSVLGGAFRNVIPTGDVIEAVAAEFNFNRRQRRLLSLPRPSYDKHELVARLLGFRPTSDPSHMKVPLKAAIESLPPLPAVRESLKELASVSPVSSRAKWRAAGFELEPGSEGDYTNVPESPASRVGYPRPEPTPPPPLPPLP